MNHAATQAAHSALLLCFVAFLVATLVAWIEPLIPAPRPSALRRRLIGSIAVLLAVGAAVVGGLAVSTVTR